MNVSIVIASHGDPYWAELALTRAFPSAVRQDVQVLIDHGPEDNRAAVRNRLTEQASGDYIVTLDADDELAPGYVDAIRRAWEDRELDEYLFTPRVQYVTGRSRRPPRFWPEIPDLQKGNWMVVGTAFPRDLMLEVGGWRTHIGTGQLNEYDDYDLWIRLKQAGCRIVKVPSAVYVAHQMRSSAHRKAHPRVRREWHREILRANGLPDLI